MASINPTYMDCNYSPHVFGKTDNRCRITITEITQTGGAENKTRVKGKVTVEGTPYTYLYALLVKLGGRTLYDHHTGGAILTSWSAGHTIFTFDETFNNNNDGSLTLTAYIKQMFYYGNGDTSRWSNPRMYQEKSTDMVCSTIPRYATPWQSLNETGDNYIKMNWGADVNCDWLQYSIDGGANWVDASGFPVYTISGLSPNTTYNVATRVRRQDSGLWSNTSATPIKTLASPYISALSDFNIGSSLACTIYNPKGRNLTLKLLTSGGTQIASRTTNVNGTYTFVLTESENNDLYNAIPNSPSGQFRISVYCSDLGTTNYSNSSVGWKTFYAVENACSPEVEISAVDCLAKSLALTGDANTVIKYVSDVLTEITAYGNKSAKIKTVIIQCSDGQSQSYSTDASTVSKSKTFSAVESAVFSCSVVDSRGFTKTVSIALGMVNYIPLTLNADVYRPSPTNGNIAVKFKGNVFNDNFGSVDNTLTVKYRYKEHGTDNYGSWVDLNPVKNNNTYSNGTGEITLGTNFDYQKKYDFEFVALDKINDDGSISVFHTVLDGQTIYDWGKDDFNINGKLNLYETSIIRHIANILWPVNSTYPSLTNSIPEYLAGEWSLMDTIVNNGHTYYIFKRTSEDEKLYYQNVELLYNGEEIYIENTLLKGDDVL